MADSFVSLDIDFFNPLNHTSLRPYLDQLTALCRARRIPLSAVMNHQQMLGLVNESPADRLVNLDTHSDLGDTSADMLTCGSWVAYVKWRKQGSYQWLHAGHASAGECNGEFPIFGANGRGHYDLTDWAHVSHRRLLRPPKVEVLLKQAVAVAVCSSPMYSYDGLEDHFVAWRKQHGVPYRKGRRDETYGRQESP